ncbi:hypothetical protein MTO96_003449 [Rhipicephalus appendiculatus]
MDSLTNGLVPAGKSDDRQVQCGLPESQQEIDNHATVGATSVAVHEVLVPADNSEPAPTSPSVSRLVTLPADQTPSTMSTTRPATSDSSSNPRRKSEADRLKSSPLKREKVVTKPEISPPSSPDRERSSLRPQRSVQRSLECGEHSSTLQNLRYNVIWIAAMAGLLMILVVLMVSLLARGSTSSACRSPACVAYSKVFEGVLNYSVDPCVDMDAFVCSRGAGYDSSGWRAPVSLVAHVIRRYQMQMVELFLSSNTKFTASKIVTNFLLECTSTYKTPLETDSFIDIFNLVPVPWPFENSSTSEVHPLEAVLTLSMKFGVDTWFRAYVGDSRKPASGSSTTLAVFIEFCAQPSLWFSFMRAMGDRRALYFDELHRFYNAKLPDSERKDSLLATEEGVLFILHNARTQGAPGGPAVASIAKIASFVKNSTVSNWLEPVTASPGGDMADESTLLSLNDVRILRAVDALLSTFSVDALTKHLSWWLVQILTIIGWSQGYYVIAGSQTAAAAGAFVECYSIAASKVRSTDGL